MKTRRFFNELHYEKYGEDCQESVVGVYTGLAAYLTSWPTAETLMNGNASRAFFETYVVGEILKSWYNSGKEPPLYYYRDIDRREVDLLMVEGGKLYPMEIKKAKNPSDPDSNFSVLKRLGLEVMPGLVMCMADELFPINRQAWLCPVGKSKDYLFLGNFGFNDSGCPSNIYAPSDDTDCRSGIVVTFSIH